MLLTNILHVCGCGSVLELLVGELPSGYVHTSPYLQVEGQRDGGDLTEETSGELEVIERKSSATDVSGHVVEERDIRADGEVCESIAVDLQSDSKVTGDLERHQLGSKMTDGSKSEETLETKRKLEGFGTVNLESPFDTRSRHDVVTTATDTPKGSCAMVFRSGLLKAILLALRPTLNKENWKKSPNAKHTLVWCLRRLKVIMVSNIHHHTGAQHSKERLHITSSQ